MFVNLLVNGCAILLLDFFPFCCVPEAGGLALLCHPTISHLTCAPGVSSVMEAKEYSTGDVGSPCPTDSSHDFTITSQTDLRPFIN